MKLTPFNLEEALANPERVVCNGCAYGVKLVKWQYHEDVHKEGFDYPIATWFDINGAKAYSANSVNGKSIRGVDYNLMLKAKKKTTPFDETLLGKEGVRVLHKDTGDELFFKYKSDKIAFDNFVFERYGMGRWYCDTFSVYTLKNYYVMEVEE